MNRALIGGAAAVVVAGVVAALYATSGTKVDEPSAPATTETVAPSDPDAATPPADPFAWHTITPADDVFTAVFPGPAPEPATEPRIGRSSVPTPHAEWVIATELTGDRFMITRSALWQQFIEPMGGLDAVRAFVGQQASAGDGRGLLDVRDVVANGVAGLEATYELPRPGSTTVTATTRFFPVGDRLYQVLAICTTAEGKARIRQFIDGFTFTDAVGAVAKAPMDAWQRAELPVVGLEAIVPSTPTVTAAVAAETPWGKREVTVVTARGTAPAATFTATVVPLGDEERKQRAYELHDAWQKHLAATLPAGAQKLGPPAAVALAGLEGRVVSVVGTGGWVGGFVVGDHFLELSWAPADPTAAPLGASRFFESLRPRPAPASPEPAPQAP